jgi:hypothetical protein
MSARTPIHHLRYYSSKPQIGKKALPQLVPAKKGQTPSDRQKVRGVMRDDLGESCHLICCRSQKISPVCAVNIEHGIRRRTLEIDAYVDRPARNVFVLDPLRSAPRQILPCLAFSKLPDPNPRLAKMTLQRNPRNRQWICNFASRVKLREICDQKVISFAYWRSNRPRCTANRCCAAVPSQCCRRIGAICINMNAGTKTGCDNYAVC